MGCNCGKRGGTVPTLLSGATTTEADTPFRITTPDGDTHDFPNEWQADAYRARHGGTKTALTGGTVGPT